MTHGPTGVQNQRALDGVVAPRTQSHQRHARGILRSDESRRVYEVFDRFHGVHLILVACRDAWDCRRDHRGRREAPVHLGAAQSLAISTQTWAGPEVCGAPAFVNKTMAT